MSHILVVDDDPGIRALVRDVLEIEGYSVEEAVDGPAALRAVEARRPACVVLDVMMPGLDGYAVLAALRAVPGPTLPVCMLTAAADDTAQWRAWSGGVDWFLPKPFDAEALLRFVENVAQLVASPAA